jgi:hypothetical protein
MPESPKCACSLVHTPLISRQIDSAVTRLGGSGVTRHRGSGPAGSHKVTTPPQTNSELGFDIGAGVMGYFSNRVGLPARKVNQRASDPIGCIVES